MKNLTVFLALFAIAFADNSCFEYSFTDDLTTYVYNTYLDEVNDGWTSISVASGQTYYFTTSSCATENSPCPADANACVMNPDNSTIVLGTFSELVSSLSENGYNSGMSIVSLGEGCNKVSINLLWNTSDNEISVQSEGCYTDIIFSSPYFEPTSFNQGEDSTWAYWNNGGVVMFAIIFGLIISGFCICCMTALAIVACYKCCTDKKYKKRENIMLQNTKVAFQPLPTQEPATPSVQYVPVSPYHPMTHMLQQQPMMYFHPVPQQQAQTGKQHTVVQVEEDEKLARKLQAELNGN